MLKPDNFEEARILVVDDCEETARTLADLLALRHYRTIHVTTNAATVCDLQLLNDYDLILLDMHMPGVDGLKVMQQLKKIAPNSFLPVIVITGNKDLRMAALDAGAYDFITKPIAFDEVDLRVRNSLRMRLQYRFLGEQQRLQQNVALCDPLTGLASRQLALDRMASALKHAKRHGRMVGLLYLDMDEFKLINDQYGQDLGDRLLMTMATRLGAGMRDEDTVARLGGDEFLIVLPELPNLSAATIAARKVLDLFSRPMQLQGLSLKVTTSIGIAVYAGDEDDAEILLQRADQALYAAKRAGKNRYCFGETAMAQAG